MNTGTKVKLKQQVIESMPDRYSDKFKKWVKSHKDTVFTVFYEQPRHKRMFLCSLKDERGDTNEWLFTFDILEEIR